MSNWSGLRRGVVLLIGLTLVIAGCVPSAIEATATQTQEPRPTQQVTAPPTRAPDTPSPKPSATPEITVWSSTSPDGMWTASGQMQYPVFEDGQEMYSTQLKVASADGKLQWIVVDATSPFGLGYTTPQPFKWSSDGRYLYYTDQPAPDGCAIYLNAWGLYRVDLADGQVTEVAAPEAWWLSLSPDESLLASVIRTERGLDVAVRKLVSGAERRVELDAKYAQAGNVAWSPDQAAIVLAADHNPCSGPDDWTRSVIRLELATLAQSTLIDDAAPDFSVEGWPELERITLLDQSGGSRWLNPTTGEVTSAE